MPRPAPSSVIGPGAGEPAAAPVPTGADAPRPGIGAGQLARTSIGLGAVTIWLGLLGLITTPILIHHLGTTRYGVFALITIMSAYLSNLEFGFGHATVRFLARDHAAGDRAGEVRVVRTSLAVFLIGGLFATGIALAAAPWIASTFFHGPAALRPEATDAIRLGALILFFSFLSSFASAGLQAIARFQIVVGTRGVFGTLASVTAVAAVLVGGHLRLVLAAQAVVAGGLCAVVFVALVRNTGIRPRPRIHWPTFKAMARFGAFVLIAGLAYQVLLQGPPTVLAHFSETTQVAAFAVPNLVLQQLAVLATATSVAFMPFASAASVNPDRSHLSAVYRSNLRLTLLVTGPVAVYLAIFAHPLLATWIDPGFAAKATAPLQFLALASVMLAVSAAPADVARGLGNPRWVAVYTTIAAIVAVGASFVVAKAHGAGGVAFAFALGLTVTTLPFIVLVARGMLGLSLGALARALGGPIGTVGGLAILCLAAAAISDSFAMAVLAGLVGSAAYAITAFKLVLDHRERAALRRNWRRPRLPHSWSRVRPRRQVAG